MTAADIAGCSKLCLQRSLSSIPSRELVRVLVKTQLGVRQLQEDTPSPGPAWKHVVMQG